MDSFQLVYSIYQVYITASSTFFSVPINGCLIVAVKISSPFHPPLFLSPGKLFLQNETNTQVNGESWGEKKEYQSSVL